MFRNSILFSSLLALVGCGGTLYRTPSTEVTPIMPLTDQTSALKNAEDTKYVGSLMSGMTTSGQPGTYQTAVGNFGQIISAMAMRSAAMSFQIFAVSTQLDAVSKSSARHGSQFIHWGSKKLPPSAPAGSSVLYTGTGFGAGRQETRQRDAECFAPEDRKEVYATSGSSDSMYPLTTGGLFLPPGVQAAKLLVCSLIYVPADTFLLKGSANCPAGWSAVYSGYLMGGHYSFQGAPPNSLCVNNSSEFDGSVGITASDSYAQVNGTHTLGAIEGHPDRTAIKCAVCSKD